MVASFRSIGYSVAALVFSTAALAQDTLATRLPPVVTVTRDIGRSPLDLPFAISVVRPNSLLPGQTHTMVEQTLSLLPGVTVANRTNPSQDTRVSVRGFGARSQFGARSIRILRDGMPLTLPDGQTPIDYLDLESVERVEVIRGAAAALYGNAAGGVIDLKSGPAPDVPFAVQARSWLGTSAMRRYVGLFGGSAGVSSYNGNIGRTASDGFRQYAHQRLTNAFVRGSTTIAGTEVALVGLGLDMPLAENPGALTRAQVDSSPEQADRLSVSKRARKSVHQVQVGLSLRRPVLQDGEIVAQGFGGTRTLFNPLTFAIVGVDRQQSGAGGRVTLPFHLGDVSNRLSFGADAQWLSDARKNWANCNAVATANASCPTLTQEKGVLTLNQREIVSSFGPYVRDELVLGRFRASAGVRSDRVRFELRDKYLADGRNDSGERTLKAVSPMFGVAARLSPFHSVYANAGSAFETPTTTELGNRADSTAGLNKDLKPQYSTTYETGAKGLAFSRVQYDVAVFDTEVRDELIPFELPGGRTYYRNAGRTRRRGAELQLVGDVGRVSLAASYALSNFHFRDFKSGSAQFAGKTIPGIPEHQYQTSATVHFANAFVLGEVVGKSKVFVNDANSANAFAAPYTIFNARIGGKAAFGRPWLSPVVGVQNLFDRHYVGSVAVNASGASIAATKFYEPAPGRMWLFGLSAATSPW